MKKRGLIKLFVLLIVLVVVGFFWFVKNYNYGLSETPRDEIANPASEYCIHQGHSLEIRNEEEEQIGYCISSDGQECEEWAFYRGQCSFVGFDTCVKNSCCHASGCALESEAPNCIGAVCTMDCQEGTLDCGAGYCAFVDGNCEAVWNEN